MKYTILALALSLAPLSAAEAAPTPLTKSGTTLTSASRGGFGHHGHRSSGYSRSYGGCYGSSYCYPSYCYPSYCESSYCYPSYGYGSSYYRSFSHRSHGHRRGR